MQTEHDAYGPLPAPAAPPPIGRQWPASVADGPSEWSRPDLDAPSQQGTRPGLDAPAELFSRPVPAREPVLISTTTDAAYPVVAGAGEPAAPGRRQHDIRRIIVPLLIAVLAVTIGWQAWRLDRLDDRLAGTDSRLSAALAAERSRGAQADARTADLERQAQRAFNPEAIAAAVLPSVFRVRAGRFTGTAFAVGNGAADGSTNLVTNYHVVAAVWESGDREVVLERGDLDVSATLVKVDQDEDLALLRTKREAPGLTTAVGTARSGQQVVVVGAPLGLEDTVTTGVISAVRAGDRGRRIQFDAPINPGNSGGPVVNAAKQVVGVATAKARDAEGIGLAVPISTACDSFQLC